MAGAGPISAAEAHRQVSREHGKRGGTKTTNKKNGTPSKNPSGTQLMTSFFKPASKGAPAPVGAGAGGAVHGDAGDDDDGGGTARKSGFTFNIPPPLLDPSRAKTVDKRRGYLLPDVKWAVRTLNEQFHGNKRAAVTAIKTVEVST
jgi:hypothetical protein